MNYQIKENRKSKQKEDINQSLVQRNIKIIKHHKIILIIKEKQKKIKFKIEPI